ncbi:glycosyltransferase family 4 protein [Paratractidigestivibacter sp.]|uniref:glycosyltransferase family 4 protein n=1 Tax=Paratractidigestivibacter sp. TaxID=2847316 RepID=UPI002ACB118C|nr:glycosyltransferase family 4 protein [Paratractidigestivibacter sp.]
MNILVTCFTYLPRRDGVQFVCKYLCEGLAARGHHVTVLTHQHEGLPKCEVINGVHVERWPIYTKHMHHHGPREEFVRRVVDRQNEYDALVNVCTQSPMTDWLLPHLGEINRPKLLHVHSIWDFEIHPWDCASVGGLAHKLAANARWGFYYRANGENFHRYDRVFQLYEQDYSVSDFQKWYGIRSEILENAAEDAFHEGGPVPEGERSKSIVCVANFNKQKNQIALIKAFLTAGIPDGWSLDLVGSRETEELGKMREAETRLRAERGLPHDAARCCRPINYHIGISREETVSLVRKASAYAMSSMWEAFPVSLVEAMSAGTPWVSTDVGIARYLPGGVVVSDASELGTALVRICADASIRTLLGREGFDYAAKHFRIDDKVFQVEKALAELAVVGR